MTGPPLSISLDFIANGMVEMIGGVASAVILFRYAWWAPIVLAGVWLATHWLLRESAIWRDRTPRQCAARSGMLTTPTGCRWNLPRGRLDSTFSWREGYNRGASPPTVCIVPT
jgi:hypothetical protein